MRRLTTAGIAVLLSCALGAQTTRSAESRAASGPAAADGSRLVVLIVVDQLASEVLLSAWPHLGPSGFRRLARDGVWFPRALFDHACSETGPGHATLTTGASPSVHGIVGNDWIDAETGSLVGCVDDAGAPLVPSGGRGSSAHRLLAPTFGDALRAAYGPDVRIASVSIKDRSAILPAGAAGDYVAWYDRKTTFAFTTSAAFAAPGADVSWLARLDDRRPKEVSAGLVWEKAAGPAAYADLGPDDDPAESSAQGSRAFPHEIRADRYSTPAAFCESICTSPVGLDLLFGAARGLIDEARLGQDGVPDLLAISLSPNDLVGHLYGPESHEVRDMTIHTDRHLAALLADLDRIAGAGRYHVLLSSDHGVGPIPEILARRGVPAGRVNADKLKIAIERGLAKAYGNAPESRHWVRRTLDPDVLLDRQLLSEKKIPLVEAQDRAAAAALDAPGVAEAVALHRVFDGTLPRGPIYDAIRRAQVRSRSVDLYVVAKPRWLFGSNRANHGTPHEYDRLVPLFLFGPGIKRGCIFQNPVSPGSGVITLAEALGIPPPSGANHRPLDDALAK